MPDSDIVAIDFYDKVTGEFNKNYSRAFAIHKHQTSFIGTTKIRESNRLVATASGRIRTGNDLKGADADPVLLGIYRNYTEPGDEIESIKYIPPTVISLPSHLIGSVSSTLQDFHKKLGWICYEEDFIYKALAQHYLEAGSDTRVEFDEYEFVGGEYLNGNVEALSVYNDNVIFTFCGLGYRIDEGGDLKCIHSLDPLPSVKDVNQDTIKTYPLQRDITRERHIPIKIYFRKKSGGSLNTEEVLTEEDFRLIHPEYASILDSLSHVVTYTPLKIQGGYSNDAYYAMPDVKFLIPQTDIAASCKYITKGETIDQSAWFGVSTMRNAYMDRKGWLNVVNDDRFPVDHGISAEGVGASAVLLKRNKALEAVSIPQRQRDPNRPAGEDNPLVDAPFSEWTVPSYVNRALKRVFEGVVSAGVPEEYLVEADEEDDEGIQAEANRIQVQENKGNYGTIPSIAFSNEIVAEGDLAQRDRAFKIESATPHAQIDAVIHVELDYQSDEFKEYFNDKQMLSLPSSDGNKGYIFEAFVKGGQDADVGFGSVEDTGDESICKFEDGLGYVMPITTFGYGEWMRNFTFFRRVNVLRNTPATTDLLDGDNAPDLLGVNDTVDTLPMRFSVAGAYFPLKKSRLTFTNVRNMFFAGNELSISSSEDLAANTFYEPLKLYFQWISNQTQSVSVFINMGLFDTLTELKQETDPNFFTTVNSEGHADPIVEVVLLDETLVIHTESALSYIVC